MALDLGTLVQYVELDPSAFNRRYAQVAADLDRLRRQDAEVTVTADVARATAQLAGVEAAAQAIPDADVQVTADTARASTAIDEFSQGIVDGVRQGTDQARNELGQFVARSGEAGDAAGDAAGDGMGAGIMAALTALPIAGTFLALGAVAGKALIDGLENEVREDRLAATTGLDPATVKRFATAAGEAYAMNFGESIEANLDTARVAIQSGLIDPEATARSAQTMIEQLSGVADILGEDIPRVAQATATILRTGLAKDASGAFDIIVKGAQKGANQAEDLLDTFTEYPALFARLGLTGEQSLGLITQGLQAGARNSDLVADALKEFQIRATDASATSRVAYQQIGLNAEEMTAKIARGGADASEGLDEVLDGLRAIEDPVARNAAAVGLFGTQAEDLGAALFALDLSTVTADLGTLADTASGAIATLGDNTKGQLESARRNIEVAADGIKGALAAAFGDEIEGAAQSIQENRAAVVQFLLDLANGALDFGRAMIEAGASGVETFGTLSGSAGDLALQLFDIVNALNQFGPTKGKLDGAVEGLGNAALAAQDMEAGATAAADALRDRLIRDGIDPAQAKLNEFGLPLVTEAAFHDATVALASDVNAIGYAADGSQLAITRLGGGFDTTTAAGSRLDAQLRTAADALQTQIDAGLEAGRTTEELTADYAANREALLKQVEAMGFTRDEASRLIDTYGAIPAEKRTKVIADVAAARESIRQFREDIDNIPLTRTFTARYAEVIAAGGNVPGRASGGPVWPGQPFWVGEQGPELVTFGAAGYVHDAQTSAGMAAGAGAGETHYHEHYHLDSAAAAAAARGFAAEAEKERRIQAAVRGRRR